MLALFFVVAAAPLEPLFDIKAGGTPSAGTSILQTELGFSALPALAYHYAVLDSLTLGARFAFDYAYFAPSSGFAPSLLLQAPIRFSALRKGELSLGVHFEPGLGVSFPSANAFLGSAAIADVLLGAGADIAYHFVRNKLIVGGGVDMPIVVSMPAAGGTLVLAWPLLFGPIVEIHPLPPLAITIDAKFGVLFSTPGSPLFAMKLLAGAAYRF